MKAIIVTGGNKPSKKLLNSYIKSGDLIIGADKGSEYLYDYEIMPNIILGDFDSISEEKLKKIEEKQVEIIKEVQIQYIFLVDLEQEQIIVLEI